MTELSFLLDLLLNHKLPMATKVAVSDRIREVEAMLSSRPQAPIAQMARPVVLSPHMANQAPSTIAAMARHQMGNFEEPSAPAVPAEETPVTAIAQTPAAVAAMASRHQALANAGKIDKNMTRPRKF